MAKRDDKYPSWEKLLLSEEEDVDYRVCIRKVAGSSTLILAPHGGKIESLTFELASSIAGDDHNFYGFKGIKKKGNWDLHLTSHRFKEKRALEMAAACDKVVAIHGLDGTSPALQVGGADDVLGEAIHNALTTAGFKSKIEITGAYAGREPLNICNRGKTGMGVQLELKIGLRKALKEDQATYDQFVAAVRSAL